MSEHNPRPLAAEEAKEIVSNVIRARGMRSDFFGPKLFSDPAWDLLLALFQLELKHQRIATSELASAVGLPATTAVRWLDVLDREKLVRRKPDPFDARRIFVELTPRGSGAMQQWIGMSIKGDQTTGDQRVVDLLSRIYGDRQ